MKISLIGPVYPYRGGIAHFTTLLALKLVEAGNEVQMISFRKQFPKWLYPGKSDKDTSEGRIKVDANYVLSPLNPLDWMKTISLIKEFKPDRVLLQWWVTFWGLALGIISRALKRKGFDVHCLIHNAMPHEPKFYDSIITKFALSPVDSFIVMNEREGQTINKIISSNAKIMHSPLPVFEVFENINLSQDEARKVLNLPPDKKIILFFGIVRPYKGLKILLYALAEIVKSNQDFYLLIVGEFWESKQGYLDLIKNLLLTKHVRIIDQYIPDDKVSYYFNAADVFVAPYSGGTQSASVKAALGFGIPMVITEVIEDKTLKSHPEICTIVQLDNCKELAAAIIESIENDRISKEEIDFLSGDSWADLLSQIQAN